MRCLSTGGFPTQGYMTCLNQWKASGSDSTIDTGDGWQACEHIKNWIIHVKWVNSMIYGLYLNKSVTKIQ